MNELKFKPVVDKPTIIERARRPMGVPRAKLQTPDMPGFVGRWMNDVPGRLQAAVEGGYEFVSRTEAHEMDTSEVTPGNSDLGTKVSRVVGTHADGTAMRAYLMRIKKEWYDADQAEKMQRVDATADAIKHGDHDSKPSDKRYVKNISVS